MTKYEDDWDQIGKNIDIAARSLWIATVLTSISIAVLIAWIVIRLSR